MEDEDGDASVMSISQVTNPDKMKSNKITFYFVSQPLGTNSDACFLLTLFLSH